ncbi:unannotated protein [freshwater metagenome]|uniref:Unannotated protein n=1 Tax=freshwater metagenome TaxID=449393 RepID=A0A6J7EYT1_9ZZZZ
MVGMPEISPVGLADGLRLLIGVSTLSNSGETNAPGTGLGPLAKVNADGSTERPTR